MRNHDLPSSRARLISSYVDEHFQRLVEEVSELCRFESVSALGKDLGPAADWLVRKFTKLGAQATFLRTGTDIPMLFAVVPGESERTLLFYNYFDVVSEGALDEWLSEPFSPTMREGRLFARGVDSNKANLMARVHAVESFLQGTNTRPPVTIKFLLDGGEEIGSPYLPEVFEKNAELLAADGCLWAAGYKDAMGRLQISLGNKGMLYVEMRADTRRQEIHSSYGTLVPNPAQSLVRALGTLVDSSGSCSIEGFYNDVKAPSPQELQLLKVLDFAESERKSEWGLASFLGDVTGQGLWVRHLYSATCTICGLNSGYAGPGVKAILPREAVAKVEFRLVPAQRADDIEGKLRRHLEAQGFGSLSCTVLVSMNPSRTPPNAPLVQAAKAAAQEVYLADPVLLPISPVSGFSGLVESHLGAATLSAGVGDMESSPHGPNESISLSDYRKGVLFVAALISNFAQNAG